VRQVGYSQRLYRDARSTEHKILLSYVGWLYKLPQHCEITGPNETYNIFYSFFFRDDSPLWYYNLINKRKFTQNYFYYKNNLCF